MARVNKTQQKREAEQLRVRVIGLFGRIEKNPAVARELLDIADDLVQELAGSWNFWDLLQDWDRNGYRPTMRGDHNPKFTVLADLYDFFQGRRGKDVTAFRG